MSFIKSSSLFVLLSLFTNCVQFGYNDKSEKEISCGKNFIELAAFNPGVGVCANYNKQMTQSQKDSYFNQCLLYTALYFKCQNAKSGWYLNVKNPALAEDDKYKNENEDKNLGRLIAILLVKAYQDSK